MVETYGQALEYDLAKELPGIDLGELWRSRQWRKLLNYIDHLPSHTHFSSLVSMDEKHAEMLLEAQEAFERAGGKATDGGPSLTSWTPEVNLLASIYDAIHGVQFAVSASVGGKPDRPVPYPRPKTAIEIVRLRRRQHAHEDLTARMLPKVQE